MGLKDAARTLSQGGYLHLGFPPLSSEEKRGKDGKDDKDV